MPAKKKLPYVIIRTDRAGVHAGELASRKGREVQLKNSRRLWYWKAASGFTLSSVSIHGLGGESKISEAVPSIELLDAIEVIPCSPVAEKSIRAIAAGRQ